MSLKNTCIYCRNSEFSDYLLLNNYNYKRCKNCKSVQECIFLNRIY